SPFLSLPPSLFSSSFLPPLPPSSPLFFLFSPPFSFLLFFSFFSFSLLFSFFFFLFFFFFFLLFSFLFLPPFFPPSSP
ncbi:hypothetical protein ACXWRS_12345, partial [Streptococcus pyogenes]